MSKTPALPFPRSPTTAPPEERRRPHSCRLSAGACAGVDVPDTANRACRASRPCSAAPDVCLRRRCRRSCTPRPCCSPGSDAVTGLSHDLEPYLQGCTTLETAPAHDTPLKLGHMSETWDQGLARQECQEPGAPTRTAEQWEPGVGQHRPRGPLSFRAMSTTTHLMFDELVVSDFRSFLESARGRLAWPTREPGPKAVYGYQTPAASDGQGCPLSHVCLLHSASPYVRRELAGRCGDYPERALSAQPAS